MIGRSREPSGSRRSVHGTRCRPLGGALVALLVLGGTASAQSDAGRPAQPQTQAQAIDDGADLPLARGLPGGAGTVRADAGWDGAAGEPVGSAQAQVTVWRHISAIGGALYTSEGVMRPFAGAALRMGDVAVSAVYRPEGLTEPEGEIELGVDGARHIGSTSLYGGLTYGQDPDARERDAEETFATAVRLGGRVWVGAGERARVALATPPAGEATWDLAIGPSASLDGGPVIVTAFAGFAARDLDGTTYAGVSTSLGLARRF